MLLLLLPDCLAAAFHNGGVGSCNGCHFSHHTSGAKGAHLLQASDPSSVCLNCHAGPGGPASGSVFSADGSALTPGGDFYWLTRTFTWADGSSPGDSHGHNVVALDYGLTRDSRWTAAPGGAYPAADLSCISCHDPHGRVAGGTASGAPAVAGSGSYGTAPAAGAALGNYRLLGDDRYDAGRSQSYPFSYPAPVAAQNPAAPYGESDSSHADYGSGMSEWCANCHADYLGSDHAGLGHASGAAAVLPPAVADHYNTYVRTGDLSGTAATAYLQFAPFERGTSDPGLLDPTSTQGPDANARVMCLSCHRAHGSAFRAAGRWDFTAELLAESHPAPGDGGASGNDVLYSYYGRNIESEFGSGQKQFCEKCHAGI